MSEDGYSRIVKLFDEDETAGSFLREDGEGGFAGGVYRMAREIDRLRSVGACMHEALERLVRAKKYLVHSTGREWEAAIDALAKAREASMTAPEPQE